MIDDYNDHHMFDNETEPDEFIATAGEPIEPTESIASEEAIIDALHTVYDPEIPIDIYELGLIYEIEIKSNGSVDIEMSLTSPGCPVAGEMPGDVARTVAQVPGVGEVIVKLIWEPMWTPDRMSEDAKIMLGMLGIF